MNTSKRNQMQEPTSYLGIAPDRFYRKSVGVVLVNNEGKIFVGRRIDTNSDAWQMPQGGLNLGESEDSAMFRELKEETGISKKDVKIVKRTEGYYYYNLPNRVQKKFWKGRYLGQKQRWYLAKFLGNDACVNLKTDNQEFSDWMWMDRYDVIDSIVSFKKDVYEKVLAEFAQFLN